MDEAQARGIHGKETTPFLLAKIKGVSPRSRMDLAPAQTTMTGVRASSSRSAEMSMVVSAPRCTPPMPPVAEYSMDADVIGKAISDAVDEAKVKGIHDVHGGLGAPVHAADAAGGEDLDARHVGDDHGGGDGGGAINA